MPAQLSKPQIRLIQTLNACDISSESGKKKCDKLYILSKSHLYLASFDDTNSPLSKDILEGKEISLVFKDKKESLICKGKATIITKDDEDFEDASDFLAVDAGKIDHVVEFCIESVG